MIDPKKQLNITLTEPVVFLRSADPSGRLQSDPGDSPTLVRGILTLDVAKPIGISSIEVELSAILEIIYPEPNGSRRIDIPEKSKIYSSTVSIFRADQARRPRLSVSVGPGLSPAYSDRHGHAETSSLPSLPRGRPERRNITGIPPDLGPTPPYTVARSSTSVQSRPGTPGEHPNQTLEELRQALGENLERNPGSAPQSSRSSTTFSIPNVVRHSDGPGTSNDSFHREFDIRPDDSVHPGSPLEGDTPSHNTTEEPSHVPPRRGSSLSRHFRSHSSESGTRPSQRGSNHDSLNSPTSPSRLRISIASVLDAVKEITSRAPSRSRSVARSEERERGRTRVRAIVEGDSRTDIPEMDEGLATHGDGSQPGLDASHSSDHPEHGEHHLLGLGRILGLERHHATDKDGEHQPKDHRDGWREFQPGVYSYPISFMLPPHLPPSFSLPNASISYVIKGIAHRPGAFTSKLSCQVPLLVVASPAVGTGEGGGAGDPGPLFVEKEWQGKLAYSIGLSSRLFLLGSERRLGAAASDGAHADTESMMEARLEARADAAYGTATLDLTLLPTEKIKIWKLNLFVDERIRYSNERGLLFREDDKILVRLLEVQDTCPMEELGVLDEQHAHKNKHKHKHEPARIPLLPTPLSPHRSPLLRYLPPSSDPSTLAGPGPYVFSTTIGLPCCNDRPLHFTVKQKCSRVKVDHSLRLVMRVEPVGDEDINAHKDGGKPKLVDITVQTPITVLSCRCTPEYQALPRYSRITEDNSHYRLVCPCRATTAGTTEQGSEHGHDVGHNLGHVISPSSPSLDSEIGPSDDRNHRDRNGRDRSRSHSRTRRSGHANPLTVSHHPPPSPGSWNRSPSHAPPYAVSTNHVRGHSHPSPFSTPHSSRPPSPLARYERLVSGLESEAGEAPPSYESVASGSGTH